MDEGLQQSILENIPTCLRITSSSNDVSGMADRMFKEQALGSAEKALDKEAEATDRSMPNLGKKERLLQGAKMHFNISVALIALTLATAASADRLIVSHYGFLGASTYTGTFITKYDSYLIGEVNGCHTNPGVPSLNRLCMDFDNGRGHFQFNGQGKRCFKETSNDFQHCSDDFAWATCSKIYYDEVKCTW
ncbi:hypothetical protein V491_01994 [Pseudogymnoascus sp. VKM F-3775]|nr:hypothetical protein V491_01994 [Pseudogymnoascus sp. VKM F-3775]